MINNRNNAQNLNNEVVRKIQFRDSELKNLVKSVKKVTFNNQSERGGGIYFDWYTHTVSFYELPGSVDSKNYDPFNCYLKRNAYGILLGIVHTHPAEQYYLSKGLSDQTIFNTQSNETISGADGQYIKGRKFMLYSVGYREVDFYSPKGKGHSKNGLCSNDSVSSGGYNLMKHALQMYGRQNRF